MHYSASKLEALRIKFFKSLPATHNCVGCKKRKSKDHFGVRLMNGPDIQDKKADPVFRIQPRCTTCR